MGCSDKKIRRLRLSLACLVGEKGGRAWDGSNGVVKSAARSRRRAVQCPFCLVIFGEMVKLRALLPRQRNSQPHGHLASLCLVCSRSSAGACVHVHRTLAAGEQVARVLDILAGLVDAQPAQICCVSTPLSSGPRVAQPLRSQAFFAAVFQSRVGCLRLKCDSLLETVLSAVAEANDSQSVESSILLCRTALKVDIP